MSFEFLKEEIENSFMSKDKMNYSLTGDGRLDSAESESSVIKHLKELFKDSEIEVIEAPAKRYWYDVLIKYQDKLYPINIKITTGESADNVSSKEGLFYSLTGLWPEKVSGLSRWESYNKSLVKNLNFNSEADYYFVVYFKNEETFLFTSLKRLNSITSNGNNLPFQCKWSDNCEKPIRTTIEQGNYLMETYYDSWIKKVGGFEPLINWRNDI